MTVDAVPMAPGATLSKGQILYSRHTPPNGTVWLFDARSGQETKITDGARPRLSPDRRYLVFLRDGLPYSGRGNVYLRDLLQNTERFFAPQFDFITGVCFSPDGSRVLYDHSCGMFSKALDAISEVAILPDAYCYDDGPAANGVDGRIAFHNVQRGQIGLANADGSGKSYIDASPTDEAWPLWSPDGQWIAATAAGYYGGFRAPGNLIKVRPDGTGFTWLTSVTAPSEGFINGFAWTPDGQAIVAGGVVDGVSGVFVVAADGRGILARVPVPSGDPVDWVAAVDANADDLVARITVTITPGGKIRLSWPSGLSTFRLLVATDLLNPDWQPYADAGSNSVVIDPKSGPAKRYFRLSGTY
jgi:WD40 repeat protein